MSNSGDRVSNSFESVRETAHVSWFARIKQAVVGVLIGLVLVLACAVGVFWNEGRAVQTARSLAEGAGIVVDIDPGRVDPAYDGRLVHVTGDLRPGSPLADPVFAVSADAVRLDRTVEMYQWQEESRTETRKNLGGSEERVTTYSYHRGWADRRIDSSRFHRPAGHENPEMRYSGALYTSRDATLGAFRPGEAVLKQLPANRQLPLDPSHADRLKDRIRGPIHVADDRLYLGADPAQPRLGDLRITYRVVDPGPVSIVGRQAGSDFAEYQTKAGDRLLMVTPGHITAADMFRSAEFDNQVLTWLLRLAGVVVMFIGWVLMFRPLQVVADVVPLFGSLIGAGVGFVALVLTAVVAPFVIAVAWLWYRPLVSVVVLGGGLAVAVGLRVLARRRVSARTATAPAASAAAT